MFEYAAYDPSTFDPHSAYAVRERSFERSTFAVTRELPPDAYRYRTDELRLSMREELTAYIYYESMGRYDHSWTFPTTWWDHFKQECFPKWLLEKYPAQYTTKSVTLDARAIFPDWNPPRGYTEPRYIIREIDRTF